MEYIRILNRVKHSVTFSRRFPVGAPVNFTSKCGKSGQLAGHGGDAMPYFALIYEVVDDYIERRASLRQAHLKIAADAHAKGELILGGAFADPPDKVLIVFHAADKNVAEDFARNDPYVIHGLVKKWEVRPWTVVIGGPQA